MTQEERERAWAFAMRQLGHGSDTEVSAWMALRDCVPVPRDELERYKRALEDIASGRVADFMPPMRSDEDTYEYRLLRGSQLLAGNALKDSKP